MKKIIPLTFCLTGALFLAACSNSNAAQDTSSTNNAMMAAGTSSDTGNPNPGQMMQGQGMSQQNLQQYVDQANAAPDKTTLTKDQYMTELQTLMQAQRAKFQQQSSGGQQFSRGTNPRFGSGSRPQGANGGMQNRLASATTFIKYTDPNGTEVLLALDANGNVLTKWPRAFGNRGPGGGGQAAPSSESGAQQ